MTRKDFVMSVKTFLSNIASYWNSTPGSENPIPEVSIAPESTTEAKDVPVGITRLPYPNSLPFKYENCTDPTVGFIIPVIRWKWVLPSDLNSYKELYSRGIGTVSRQTTTDYVTKIKIMSVVTDSGIVEYLDLLRSRYEYKPPVYHCVALDGRDHICNTGTPAYKGFRFFIDHSMACDMINDYLDTDNPDRMVVFTDWYRRMGHLTETKVG